MALMAVLPTASLMRSNTGPLDVTRMFNAFARGVIAFLFIQRVYLKRDDRGRWTDYKVLPGVTEHTLTR